MAEPDTKLILAISADVSSMRRAMEQAGISVKKTTEAMNDNFRGVGTQVDRTSKQIQASMQNATRNLTFQFQDVTTSLLSGASPFQVAAQQASQAGEAIRDLGRQGGLLKGLGGALAGMLSPQTLGIGAAILAFGYLTQAAKEYFTEADEGSEEANKALEEQRELVRKVAQEYGEALPKLKAYNDQRERAETLAEQQKAVAAGRAEAEADAAAVMARTNKEMEKAIALFARTPKQEEKLRPVIKAWEELKVAVANGTATMQQIEQFQALFNQTAAKLPLASIRQFGTIIDTVIVPGLKAAVEAMQNLANEQQRFGAAGFPVLIGGTAAAAAGGGKEAVSAPFSELSTAGAFLKSRAVSDRIAEAIDKLDEDFSQNLAEFLRKFPNVRIASAFRSFEEQRRIYESGVRPAAKPGRSLHEKGLAVDLTFGGMSAAEIRALQQEAQKFGIDFPLPGTDAGHAQSLRVRVEAAQEAADTNAKNLDNERQQYDALIVSITAKLDAQIRENQINGDLTASQDERTAAIERARIVEQLNNQAKLAGIAVDDQLIAKHEELAAKMVASGLAATNLARQHQELARARKEDTAEAERLATAYTNIARQSFATFVGELRNGASAADAFRAALDRVIDGIVDMTIQTMFAQDNLGGLIRQFFGLGGGKIVPGLPFPAAPVRHQGGPVDWSGPKRQVSPLAFVGAPRFASGGIVGLRPGEVPIIAHQGEVVLPRLSKGGKAAGIDNSKTYLGDVTVNVPAGVVATSEQGKQIGLMINKSVEAILVKESRPGGLLRQRN
ncbi:phage tail length tape measure family protein [Sinorhizobium meliloti]|uniref:phage tail length tape measure family protein n=1 Tax=Rhizobium meliloti TaxID=382 RepID=UPI000B498255|nr:phage tail length tape measure family protein [Sinorhizobium meliloti]ASP51468.1 hypothetical protein CDO31_07725 [Sinorhizobium meliloti]